MPKLLLLRHAKAERARPGEKDHDRALAERGREDALAMGGIIAGAGYAPDLVLCSTSLRTRQTWDGVRPAAGKRLAPRFLREIYEADGDYGAIIREHAGRAATLLLIGHNPAVHVTALRYAEDLASPDGAGLTSRFPTSALAVLGHDGSWQDIRPGTMRLEAFLCPPGGGD